MEQRMDSFADHSEAMPHQASNQTALNEQYRHDALDPLAQITKRLEDLVLGVLLLLVFSPVLIVLAILIKLDSPGQVFFRQTRRGRNLRPFLCLKFRTMCVEHTDHVCNDQTQHGDPRVTRFGAVLRHRSLDELPQLLNVMLGHMSLCGPRPHSPGTKIDGRMLEDVNADYLRRYCVKPGITGWAQTNGWRGVIDTPEKLAKRVEFDLYYIKHWSLWLDMQILFQTMFCLYGDEGAY
jgi:polysaccharide biosynthesis protein PslA